MTDKITEQDLAVLVYEFGNSVKIFDFEEAKNKYPHLKADLEHRLWEHFGSSVRGIGDDGTMYAGVIDKLNTIIGIYDRRNTKHLNQMFKDAEAVRRRFSY